MHAKHYRLTGLIVAIAIGLAVPIATSSTAQAARCGGVNQKPCAIFTGKRFCQKGLIHVPFVKCLKPKKERMRDVAMRGLRASKHVIRIIGSMRKCISGRHRDAKHLMMLLKNKRRFNIKKMPVYRHCIHRPSRSLHALGYKSLQIGVAGSAGVIIEGAHEQGIALSTNGSSKPWYYQTWGYGIGYAAGASVNLAITANRARPNRVRGNAQGFVGGAYASGGGGVGVWLNYGKRPKLMAISVFGGAGVQGKGFVYTRNKTLQTS
ncbi:MAG: hypothetical protein ACR2PI_14570 [Hyphomicrobiaceae bacterium]